MARYTNKIVNAQNNVTQYYVVNDKRTYVFGEYIDKLGKYEDLGYEPEELAKLLDAMNQDKAEKKIMIELPCKIGDTVYIIGSKYRHGQVEKWVNTGKFRLSDMEKLNETVFLTEEVARQKLKEI